jgi:hypothetical protein
MIYVKTPYQQNTSGHAVDTAQGQAIILQSQCEISKVPFYTGLTEMYPPGPQMESSASKPTKQNHMLLA